MLKRLHILEPPANPSLPDIDMDVLQNGKPLLIVADLPGKIIESWVWLVSRQSGQKIDWSWVGGRAIIKVVGDYSIARKVAEEIFPLLEKAYRTHWHHPDSQDLNVIWVN